MRSTEPHGQTNESLIRENEELRRQLDALRSRETAIPREPSAGPAWSPSKTTILALALFTSTLIGVAFLAGYLPMRQRRSVVVAESLRQTEAIRRVSVVQVSRTEDNSGLQLPGSIQAINEAPILARTDGYLKARLVDLGDRVKAGQPLAEIDAPEMEEVLRGARASLEQAQSALDQATANLEQGKSDLELARVSAQRWSDLTKAGIASRQDDDRYRLEYQSRVASVNALEKALNVQRSSVAVAQANVARMENLKSYKIVKAPFDGVITLRNVDAGALVNAGSTMLFRIAQTQRLRTYVSVPQSWVSSVRTGQTAIIRTSAVPGREFAGAVARSASALDPTSRTLLIEINVPNTDGALMPGMSVQADLSAPRRDAPLVVPADALLLRSNGSEVAVVKPDATVHIQKITVGRDYGDRFEVLEGLKEGDTLIRNPGDGVREGLKVEIAAGAAPSER